MTICALGDVISSDADSVQPTLNNIVAISAPSGSVRNGFGYTLDNLAVANLLNGAHVSLRVSQSRRAMCPTREI